MDALWSVRFPLHSLSALAREADAGHLRTLYPLTEHKDFEAIRKSVSYDLPSRQ